MDQKNKSFFRRHRWLLWLGGSVLVVLIALSVALAIVARRFEPFLRARIIQGLSDRFHTHVELDGFHVAVNNIRRGQWGIWAVGSGLRIWPPQPVNGVQDLDVSNAAVAGAPLISLQEFSFHVPLRWEETKLIRIAEVRLNGLNVVVPPRAGRTPQAVSPASKQSAGMAAGGVPQLVKAAFSIADSPRPSVGSGIHPALVVDRVVCENVDLLLETNKPGKLPMHFPIPHLTLTNATPNGPVGYVADVLNPKPLGMVHSVGTFGPWVTADPGLSAVSGTYHMEKADMGVFKGIAGLITSDGHFTGTLRNISVTGTTTVPDFRLTHFGNPMHLTTRFDARVDGTDGDTWLDKVDATLGQSQFTTAGEIVRVRIDRSGNEVSAQSGQIAPEQVNIDGHSINLNVNVPRGQLEDFLKLTSKSGNAMLTGELTAKAHLVIPPGHIPVEQRLKLDGTFQLSNAQFTSEKVQEKLQQLSLRGQGKPNEVKTADPALVRSDMSGTFHMANGIIALPDLNYRVPGADIQLQGSYALEGPLEFTGTARMDATVSQMVGGWKGLLLKPADKFFKKDGAGTQVPITIKGTREAPEFAVDFGKLEIKSTKPESPADKQSETKQPDTKQQP
ncbi:MAG TPA: AsmA-like C-terminal region-containing protein [Terracidiphilus sp.]